MPDGFYAVFITGPAGNSIALLSMLSGVVVGTDAGGATYDGTYIQAPDGHLDFRVVVRVPPAVSSVQGFTVGPDGLSYTVEAKLPADFATRPYVPIMTQFGPVHGRFQHLRSWEPTV